MKQAPAALPGWLIALVAITALAYASGVTDALIAGAGAFIILAILILGIIFALTLIFGRIG